MTKVFLLRARKDSAVPEDRWSENLKLFSSLEKAQEWCQLYTDALEISKNLHQRYFDAIKIKLQQFQSPETPILHKIQVLPEHRDLMNSVFPEKRKEGQKLHQLRLNEKLSRYNEAIKIYKPLNKEYQQKVAILAENLWKEIIHSYKFFDLRIKDLLKHPNEYSYFSLYNYENITYFIETMELE